MGTLKQESIWTRLEDSCLHYRDRTALVYKRNGKWIDLTYEEFQYRVNAISKGFQKIGINQDEKVALFAPNSPEWMYCYLATVANGSTSIPIDCKLTPIELSHILNNSQARQLVITIDDFNKNIDEIVARNQSLEYIIIIGKEVSNLTDSCERVTLTQAEHKKKKFPSFFRLKKHKKRKIKIILLHELAVQDKSVFKPKEEVRENSMASIIYTSGTMGIPKGVQLTHKNFLTNLGQTHDCIKSLNADHTERFLLVLPLNHAYAFTSTFLLPLAMGAAIIFVENLRRVAQNAKEQKPTIITGVPLLIEKIYKRVVSQVNKSAIKRSLFRFSLFKKLVGKKLKENLGGEIKGIVSGGAALDPDISKDFWTMGIPLLQGYGMTESAPLISVNLANKVKHDSVGVLVEGMDAKIIKPNEEGVGELAVKGDNVMLGYYNMPEQTEEILKDGWLYTGDLAMIDEDNYIYIKGRQKTIIVNREGKNIYPEEVEFVLNHSPFILESLILGYFEEDTKGEKVGAMIVPDLEYFEEYAAKKLKQPLTDELISKTINDEISKCSEQITTYKRPRKIKIMSEPFQKTPTQKIKRTIYSF